MARISALPGVEKIILFGSYAKHTQNAESDLDLAVFFNTDKVCLLEEYRSLVKICASTEENIEVQAFRTNELCDPCGIIGEITEFGVELWPAARLEDREESLPDGECVYQQKGY
ncbi:MAG: nucleotidyltransferase domain-containing protein [Clostridiaceae bacterium]|nr:nucleotidyltransferase domain-containing protein [Clostridiaceae bacterium]